MEQQLKVGQLAKRTGVSVRTLHHYDEIGLLRPARRSASGHRLYGDGEVRRLQRIVSLRQLGFSLDEIADCLERPEYSLELVLRLQIARVRQSIGEQQALCERLERVVATLESGGVVSMDDVIESIKETRMFEEYYTPEQLERLQARGQRLGAERIERAQEEWREIFDGFRAELEKSGAPTDAPAQALARRAAALIREFTGGDAGIAKSLGDMYAAEGQRPLARHGFEVAPEVWEFMSQAMRAARD